MSSEVLRSRDMNAAKPPSPIKGAASKQQASHNLNKSIDYHRQVLDNKFKENSGSVFITRLLPTANLVLPDMQTEHS